MDEPITPIAPTGGEPSVDTAKVAQDAGLQNQQDDSSKVDWQQKAAEADARAKKFQGLYDRELASKQASLEKLKSKIETTKDPVAKLKAERDAFLLEKQLYELSKEQTPSEGPQDVMRSFDPEGVLSTGKTGDFLNQIIQDTTSDNAKVLLSQLVIPLIQAISEDYSGDDTPSPIDIDSRPGGQSRGNDVEGIPKGSSILTENDPSRKAAMKGNLMAVINALAAKDTR